MVSKGSGKKEVLESQSYRDGELKGILERDQVNRNISGVEHSFCV